MSNPWGHPERDHTADECPNMRGCWKNHIAEAPALIRAALSKTFAEHYAEQERRIMEIICAPESEDE